MSPEARVSENDLIQMRRAFHHLVHTLETGYTFLDLSDTPDAYTDKPLYLVRVNAGQTALEFISPYVGDGTWILISDQTISHGWSETITGSLGVPIDQYARTLSVDAVSHAKAVSGAPFSNLVGAGLAYQESGGPEEYPKFKHGAAGGQAGEYDAGAGSYVHKIQYDTFHHVIGITGAALPVYQGDGIWIAVAGTTISHVNTATGTWEVATAGYYLAGLSIDGTGHLISPYFAENPFSDLAGEYLGWDGGAFFVEEHPLGYHSDVTIGFPTQGDTLLRDTDTWRNVPHNLDSLIDVAITQPQDRSVLVFQAASALWVNRLIYGTAPITVSVDIGGGLGVVHDDIAAGQGAVYGGQGQYISGFTLTDQGHVHTVTDETFPFLPAPSDVNPLHVVKEGSETPGTLTDYSRRDHQHAVKVMPASWITWDQVGPDWILIHNAAGSGDVAGLWVYQEVTFLGYTLFSCYTDNSFGHIKGLQPGANPPGAPPAGGILFGGSSITWDETNFFWDNTGKELKISNLALCPIGGVQSKIRPTVDAVNAIQFTNAAGTVWVYFNTTNKTVGIGTAASAGVALSLGGEGAGARGGIIATHASDTAATSPYTLYYRARNTLAAPATVASGDQLGTFSWRGHDGTDYRQAGAMLIIADAAPANSTCPGRLTFFTTPIGTSQAPVERYRITNFGLHFYGGWSTVWAAPAAPDVLPNVVMYSSDATTSGYSQSYKLLIGTVGDAATTTAKAILAFRTRLVVSDIGDAGWIVCGRDGIYGSAATRDANMQFGVQIDGSATPVEVFRITSAQRMGVLNNVPSSTLDVGGDVEIGLTNAYYLGDPTTDGSWKFVRNGANLLVQVRVAAAWVTGLTITPP